MAENTADAILAAMKNEYFDSKPDELRSVVIRNILGAARLMAGEKVTT